MGRDHPDARVYPVQDVDESGPPVARRLDAPAGHRAGALVYVEMDDGWWVSAVIAPKSFDGYAVPVRLLRTDGVGW